MRYNFCSLCNNKKKFFSYAHSCNLLILAKQLIDNIDNTGIMLALHVIYFSLSVLIVRT